MGVNRQQQDCEAFCEAKGWPVTEVLIDNDVSAYSGRERPGYRRLVEGIECGGFDSVVVWHPDRLHRSPIELEAFIDLVDRTKVLVASVTAGEVDLATPEGRLTARIVGSVARKESEDKSRRIRRKHLELAEAGKVSGGGRRPFGFEPDRLTIRDDEAAEIRIAAAAVLSGASLRSVVTDWNERGVETVTGAPWSTTTLKRLLCSARISGQRSHQGRIVGEAEWSGIVDADETVRLRSILMKKSGPKTTVRSYLLSGMIRCGRCDVAMTAAPVRRKGHRYRRYACRVDRGGCGRCGIGAKPVEALLVEAVLAAIDTDQLANARAEKEQAGGSEADPTSVVIELETRMGDLAEMFAGGEITRTEWLTARSGIERRLADARLVVADSSRSESATRTLRNIGKLADDWPNLDLDTQRTIVGAVIDRIVIKPTTKANNQFDSDRVEIVWLV
jgi:site-specific DNA recombinase